MVSGTWLVVCFCGGSSRGSSRGSIAAVFSGFAGEPSIERAIAYESAAEQAAGLIPEPEIVSRNTQRGAGLFTASAIYGAALGGVFSLVFAFAYRRIGDFEPRSLSALLALAGFIALVLVPELKYPANPPAIGEAATIGARTALYFAMLAISLLAMILAVTLAPYLTAKLGAWNGVLLAAAVFAGVAGLAALALPPVDEVPSDFPANVLWNFRLASIGARALLWGTLGLAFGAMTQIWLRGAKPYSA